VLIKMLRTDQQSPPRSGIQSLRSSLGSCTADLLSPGRNTSGLDGKSPASAAPFKFDNVLSSLDFALNAPALHQRCYELSVLLVDCPLKDLPTVFHIIVDKIFGLSSGSRGWGLNNVQKSGQYKDFVAISDFLSSRGPLLKACYRLLSDAYLRYEFPVALLSQPTRQQLEAGCVSPFLASKLSAHCTPSVMLQLNSFEFYMFTFAAYIVQPYTPDNKFVAGESLYPNILEDYLAYFLPCDGTAPPSLPFPLSVSTVPVVEPRPLAPATPTRKSLLKQSAMMSLTPVRLPPPVVASTVISARGQEVWRSETLMNTCAEFWLTPFSQSPPTRGRHGSPSLEAATADLTFPVSDTLRIVRKVLLQIYKFFFLT
jgi:sphingomyelin phosphodiesterase 4